MPIDERLEALKGLAERANVRAASFDEDCTNKALLNIACTPKTILTLLSTLSATQRYLEEAKVQVEKFEAEVLEEIRNRDEFEDIASSLANMVGDYFGVPVGEWSNANDPVKVAHEILDGGYVTSIDKLRSELSTTQREREELRANLEIAESNLALEEKVHAVCDEKLITIRKERDELRSALIDSGRAAGCLLADKVSSSFLLYIPEEIKLKLSGSQARVAELEKALKEKS